MKRDLLFGMSFIAALSAQAVSSPFTGSQAAEGTFYLYQVETGQWLQTNRSDIEQWTTYGTLNDTGFDIELIKPEGFEGFQIFCKMTGNGSLNGTDVDRFFLDQGNRDVTDWIFEPVTVDGVSNAYRIKAKATPEGTNENSIISSDFYMGANDGVLSDNPTEYTWQLVSRQERLEKMMADVANGPVDATWLIPWNDRGRNDMRDRQWNHNVVNSQGGGTGFDGSRGYPVQEYWHQITMRNSITLTDLPTGTYEFSIQAYYRDTEIESEELAQRFLDGSENLRATYFAGASTGTVKSIFADAKSEQTDGYSYLVESVGKWVPNSMGDASRAMIQGAYVNDYIKAPVTDGKLTIGYEKTTADHRDWLIVKRMYLRYVSKEAIAEDLTELKQQLSALIAEGESLPQVASLVSALATAREQLETATSSTALLDAIATLQPVIDAVKASASIINAYNATKAITDALGLDTAEAQEIFNSASSKADFENAVRGLRYVRRLNAIDKQADIFPGQPVAEGKYYLYNVGRQLFLCGGSDWGAHAALGFPGIEITLESDGEGAGYRFATGLYHGDGNYLNYRGYMDCNLGEGEGYFAFIPVAGKENVYNIVQRDYKDVHMGWNPYASTDNGNNDELTVGTECRNLDPEDLTAQWKLVTREERDALIEKASLENPVDMTYFMKSPNFNQRENAYEYWNMGKFNVWEYDNGNHYDFVAESYNQDDSDLNQMVENLPEGVYMVSAQAYYRYGEFSHQIEAEPLQGPIFYAGGVENDVLIPNILTESGKAPGEGDSATGEAGVTYEIPNNPVQASNYFKSGLYKVYTVVEKTDTNDLPVGILVESKNAEGDWIVADNFRIRYYGNNTTKEAVEEALKSGIENIVLAPSARPADDRIFNLQGIEVSNPTVPGIYIRNGKKFIVR